MQRTHRKTKLIGDLITAIIIAVLFLVILLLVVFSAIGYQRAVEIHDTNNNTRAVLSYVITAVKANEASGVSIEERNGMSMLIISDRDSGYEQQIFYTDGQVMESYGKQGMAPDPADALVIGEVAAFEMNSLTDDLLEIRTDIGNSYIHLRK